MMWLVSKCIVPINLCCNNHKNVLGKKTINIVQVSLVRPKVYVCLELRVP